MKSSISIGRNAHLRGGGTASVVLAAAAAVLAAGCGGHGGHGGGHEMDAGGLPDATPGMLDVSGNALFVALGTAGGIAVVDVDTWRLVGTRQLSNTYFPHHLSLSADLTRLAVGAPAADLSGGHGDGGHAGSGGALYILDSRTGDVVAQTLAGATAHNLGYLRDGPVVFALMEHGMIHFANPTNLSFTDIVWVGVAPLEATPTPAGDKVLVANSGDGTVSVVDVATLSVGKTLTVGANPIGAWLGTDGRAYVTSESDKKLSAIDLGTMTVVTTVDLPGTPGQAITTADGSEVWVALEDAGKIVILRQADLGSLGEIALGTRPHGLARSEDGSTIYLTDEGAGEIVELDVATRMTKRRLSVGGAPNGIVYRSPLSR